MHVSSLNESAAAGVLSLASCPDALSQGKPSEHVYEPIPAMTFWCCDAGHSDPGSLVLPAWYIM